MYVGSVVAALCKLAFISAFCVGLHELGHYLACLLCGSVPKAFSIGLGREVYGFTDRRGTVWRIGALPVGGYVEMPEGSMRPAVRVFVALAGPLANFLTGLVLLMGVVLYDGCSVIHRNEGTYARVGVLEVECPKLILENPALCDDKGRVRCGIAEAAVLSWYVLQRATKRSFSGIARLCSTPLSAISEFQGPVGIGRAVLGVGSMLGLLCVAVQLSFALGLFNILPILPLDGGVVLCACLGIDLEQENMLTRVLTSTALLPILLMTLIMGKDLWKLCHDLYPTLF
jgi:membrane-associated protease RseP (regulator of RpoE activity)